MAEKTYEIVADEVTILKQVGELVDPITGRSLGVQQGAGRVYLKGERVPASLVSPLMIEALGDEDHPLHEATVKRIKESSDDAKENAAVRLGVPFDGYDDMDEDEILAALAYLPSATAQAVKRYEATRGEDSRERILNFSVGFGQDPTARQEGRAGSELDEDGRDESDKVVAKIKTREVPEEGLVEAGEGITGTGDPAVAPGTAAAAEEEDGGTRQPRRRSRRARPKKDEQGEGEGSGDE